MVTELGIDPITVEVIRHGFISAADEMKLNLMRTAYNPIIYEVLDFAVGICDEDGDLISQVAALPLFLGNLPPTVKQVIADIGKEVMAPGDVYLINDTYTAGTHLNDVVGVTPVFVDDGQTLLGFTASRSNWLDIGCFTPGGGTSTTTEIYQEGLRLRSVQLYKAGKLNRDVYQIIYDNVRFSDSVMGDLRAQIACARTGERRFLEIVRRYGLDTVRTAIKEMYRMEEEASRAAIQAIPDGIYQAEAFLNDDGVAVKRPVVRVAVRIEGDVMTIDLTGSARQTVGPINCGYAATLSAARLALKAITSPLTPVNEGTFRPLKLIVPDDCMFNAKLPAPASLYFQGLMTLCDTVFKALAPAIPDRIPAAHYCDVCATFFYGTDPHTGIPYLHVEPEGGGWGATPFRDGENVLIAIGDGDTRNVPVEIIESRYPLRVERYEVRPDSGGAGRFRGGLGHYRDYGILDHDAGLTANAERSECPPWGLFGGKAAAPSRVVINPGTLQEKVLQKCVGFPLRAGDLVSIQTGGGGGYGSPWERDPEAVRQDAQDGYVTVDAAAREYGVVLDSGTLAIDEAATVAMRGRVA